MNIFNQVQQTRVKSNKFNLTHDVKLSTNFGDLTPVMAIDTLPGDRFKIGGNALVRLAPLTAPVMHRADVYMHYFFVPNRLVWPNWEDFITGGTDGTLQPVHPNIKHNPFNVDNGTLNDYLGLPTSSDTTANTDITTNALPFACYQKIYEDYFIDQNFDLATPVVSELTDGDNSANTTLFTLRKRAWEHDYFTSALPWTQRGPEVLLPMQGTADLIVKDNTGGNGTVQDWYKFDGTKSTLGDSTINRSFSGSNNIYIDDSVNPTETGYFNTQETHMVDLSSATSSSIEDLRRAFRLQEWLEKNARGGSRYIEQMRSHFGVVSDDARLQRAEYIGGFKSPIKFSEVLQTSASGSDVQEFTTPQGNMAGHGISVGGSQKFNYTCKEHGYIIGLLSALPKTAYQNGVPKHFLRSDKFDYAFPSFAHIGEQEIQNVEVFVQPTDNGETWGYTPRYAEYKFQNNRVAGDFRGNLDFWHMGRKWTSLPALNQDFIQCNNDEVDRVFAIDDPTVHKLWIQCLNEVKVSRKLPIFGTPNI